MKKRCCLNPILSLTHILKKNRLGLDRKRPTFIYFCDSCKTQFSERQSSCNSRPQQPFPESLPEKEEAAKHPVIGDVWQWKSKKVTVVGVTKRSVTWERKEGGHVSEPRHIFRIRATNPKNYSSLLELGPRELNPKTILNFKPPEPLRLKAPQWITCQCGKRGFRSKKQVRDSTKKLNHNYRIYKCEISHTWHITKN